MSCSGPSDEGWSEFFVQCKKELHHERIYYDANFFADMFEKLNLFFF